jgi:hypothetical protein
MATQNPWAVLVCRFSNDYNDPFQTHISDLYSEWESAFGSFWISQNMSIQSASDNRTIAELYTMFFTNLGYSTFNIVRYWADMSHGNIDISSSEIFPCILDITREQGAALAVAPGGKQYQLDIFKKAKAALQQQHNVDWKNYFGVIVSFQTPEPDAQGGWMDGGPGVFMDIRSVIGNGTQAWGHEMGHAYGLSHSRADHMNEDYTDPWDIMSTKAAFSAPDPLYGMRGPGLNACNMRERKWLDENRTWKSVAGKDVSQVIQLRPLHKKGLSGFLAAELPAADNHGPYLIEFRVKNNWDAQIPAPSVIIHRPGSNEENGNGHSRSQPDQEIHSHSYVMQGTKSQLSLSAGDIFETGSGPFSRVHVMDIDDINEIATIHVCYVSTVKKKPAVKISFRTQHDNCRPRCVEGATTVFVYKISDLQCSCPYHVIWNVVGAASVAGQKNDSSSFSIVAPDPSVWVKVTLHVFFDDGSSAVDALGFYSISQGTADLLEFICKTLQEKRKANPWWEWNPAIVRTVLSRYSKQQLLETAKRTEKLLSNLHQIIEHTE